MSRVYPSEVVAFITKHNEGRSAKEVADLVNVAFGTAYTAAQIKGLRARHHLVSGLSGCFKKGHVPYNKGMKRGSLPGQVATQFKAGHMPHNHKPVGSERINFDGHLERKIAEPKTWRAVRVLNWEAVHSPVKKGYVVILKDGDKTNLDISNLLLVSRAELAVMNKRGLISSDPALTEAGQMVAKLVLAASKKKKTKGKEKNG